MKMHVRRKQTKKNFFPTFQRIAGILRILFLRNRIRWNVISSKITKFLTLTKITTLCTFTGGGTAVTYFGTFILFLLQRRLRGGGLLRFHLLAGGEHFRGLLLVFFCVAVGQFSLLWRHKRIKCDSRTWTPPCTVLSHRFAQHDKSGGSSEWTGRLWHLGGRCLTQAGFPP